jgi:hypothetical protein
MYSLCSLGGERMFWEWIPTTHSVLVAAVYDIERMPGD